jgi:hypothetical protein
MIKKIFTIFLFLLGFWLSAKNANVALAASEDFQTNLISSYNIDNLGITHVTHEFVITNKTPTTFIKQYALTTGYPQISNVVVLDGGQPINPNIVTTTDQTSIAFEFPSIVVGEGKQRKFSISYSNTDLATLGGKALEIHIPKLGEPEMYDSHTVILQTPLQFGNAVRVQPVPSIQTNKDQFLETRFENVADQSISAYFGSEQYYNLSLRYHLDNPSSSKALTQVALPPETSFQELFYQSIDPIPENIELDADGNWIATFKIGANSTQPVFVNAVAKITLNPNQRVPITLPRSQHTDSANYWETKNGQIEIKAQSLLNPEEIYDFVVSTLDYTTQPIDEIPARMGAVKALENPTMAVCQEFSDLFITLSRANKIPARRLTGYAYSQNEQLRPVNLLEDILHAWPEYFDQERGMWIPVDPTWEDTTGGIDYFSQFDLNHIVFSINGLSSETPYPAGSYKLVDQNFRDIEVSFADSFPTSTTGMEIRTEPSRVFGVPLPGFHQLLITNTSGQAWYNMSAVATTSDLSIKIKPIEIGTVLPYTTKKTAFVLNTSNWTIKPSNSVDIQIKDQLNEQNQQTAQFTGLTAGPIIIGTFTEPKIIAGLAIFSILGTLVTGSVLVFRRK